MATNNKSNLSRALSSSTIPPINLDSLLVVQGRRIFVLGGGSERRVPPDNSIFLTRIDNLDIPNENQFRSKMPYK